MHVLLTGGTGFIGRRLAAQLVARGDRVTALVRKTSLREPLERTGAALVTSDLLSGEGLEGAFESVDCVLHLAGLTKARNALEFHTGNAAITRKLGELAARRTSPPRFVFCSSLAAAGPSDIARAHVETDESAPLSDYGRSKLAGEQALREISDRVPCTIARPCLVYGPGDVEFIPKLLPLARFGLMPKSGFGPKKYSLIYVDDLCDALVAMTTHGKTLDAADPSAGIYFLSDDIEYSWEQVCTALAATLGKRRAWVFPVPNALTFPVAVGAELLARARGTVPIIGFDKMRDMRRPAWTCSSGKARRELDFHARVDLPTGLREAMAWYRSNGLFS